MKLRLFRILWGIDTLISVIIVLFFVLGMVDGSVSSFNIGIWIIILFSLAIILGGSLWLKMVGYPVLGTILLLVLAVPGFLYGLFIILIVVTQVSWN